MTDRSAGGTEGQVVCPFVAFDDDRDFRSDVPDRRHRCFAESPAASRALAHQAAYCLSASFPGCPTFLDWARREAAPPKEQPVRTLREAPTAPRQADRPSTAASRAVPPVETPSPPRRGRADWTAPPPWATPPAAERTRSQPADGESAGRPLADADRFPQPDARSGPDAVPERADDKGGVGFGAWSGSALGGIVKAGTPTADARARPESSMGTGDEPGSAPPEPVAPAFLAGRATRHGDVGPGVPTADAEVPPGSQRAIPPRRRPAGYTPGAPSRSRPAGRGGDRAIEGRPDRPIARGIEREMLDPAAPSWERPRRFEAYPSLKSGGGGLASLPRPVLYALIILVAGVALFAAPFMLRGLTSGGGASATPTPSAAASAIVSAAPSVTPVPSPSPTVYIVKAGDTLSRIAGKYGLTLDQLVKANPQIKNPDKLGLGDQITIPPAVAPAITDSGTLTPAPSTAAP